MQKSKLFTTRNLVIMAMLGALATILMIFDFPVLFIAPNFYKLDFSEIPVLIGGFMLGPVPGIIIEALKVLLNLLINGTSTGGVGEFANFCMGCALVVPASLIYKFHKTKKTAVLSLVVGTVVMALVSVVLNRYIMLPFYSSFMPIDTIIAAGAAINPRIVNLWTFCWFCVMPFNLFKGIVVSVITILIYKKISVLLRTFGTH